MKTITDFIDENNCDYVNTTSEANGYPRNLTYAIVSDSFKELKELREIAENEGFICEFIKINKKDGWDLWVRGGYVFDNTWCKQISEQDYTVDINTENSEEERFEEAAAISYFNLNSFAEQISECEDFNSAIELVENFKNKTQNIVDEAGENNGVVRVFYDNDNDLIDYVISDDETGYSYDTNNYQIALVMKDLNED